MPQRHNSIYRTVSGVARRLGLRGTGRGSSGPEDPPAPAVDVDAALARILHPGDDGLFVELTYAVLLGRPVDDATKHRTCDELAHGSTTRRRFIQDIVDSAEFRTAALLEGVLTERRGADADAPEPGPRWPGTSERLVEVPWVFGRYTGERRVLDIGYAHAEAAYLAELLRLRIPDLHGVDLSARRLFGLHSAIGDARALPYADGTFDLALCVSTLEHVGHDNVVYGIEAGPDGGGDAVALVEIARVLAPHGRLLVTVPVGKFEHHGWFVQYDRRTWDELVGASPFVAAEQDIFELTGEGWVRLHDHSRVDDLGYGEAAPGARAVLCASLTKDPAVTAARR